MTIVYLVAGLVVGLLVGYMIGLSMLNKNKALWEEQLAGARKKVDEVKREATAALKQERIRASKAEEKLVANSEGVAKAKTAAEQATTQLQAYQSKMQELQKACATAQEAAQAHMNARQQAENRYRQAEATLNQAQRQITEMGAQIESLEATRNTLEQSGKRQSRQLQRLRADVASTKGGSTSGLDQSVELFAEADGTLEGVLKILLEHEGQNAAVVADSNGIIVAAAGEGELKEGMAATSQMVNSAVKQLEGMVPFSALRSYVLEDDGSNVIAGRFFKCAGENVGLATYGPRTPSDRALDGAMANLSSILE